MLQNPASSHPPGALQAGDCMLCVALNTGTAWQVRDLVKVA